MNKLEKVLYLLKKVASGEDLEQNEKEWIKDNVVEDILGVLISQGIDYNYKDLLEMAVNYYEELKDDYYSSRN